VRFCCLHTNTNKIKQKIQEEEEGEEEEEEEDGGQWWEEGAWRQREWTLRGCKMPGVLRI